MEAQEIVAQVAGDKIQKIDLIPNPQPRARVLDLTEGEARSSQSSFNVDAGRFCPRIGKPGQGSVGGGMGASMWCVAVKHELRSRGPGAASVAW